METKKKKYPSSERSSRASKFVRKERNYPTQDRFETNEVLPEISRRSFLTGLSGVALSCVAVGAAVMPALPGIKQQLSAGFFKKHFQELSPEEKERLLTEARAGIKRKFGVNDAEVMALPPLSGKNLAFALNLSVCIGCRECVEACVRENNQSRTGEMEYIRVLSLENGEFHPFMSDHHFNPELVPEAGRHYIPVQCQQCENPPCVAACPVKATWRDEDGIIVIDYDWCIGCRYCDVACPYWARRFNFRTPVLKKDDLQKNMDIQSNYPRQKGVIEKCTFCLHRVRKGLYPVCLEACPTGARKFGDLSDPDSEVSYILKNKRVFVLRAELNTRPRFYYYFG